MFFTATIRHPSGDKVTVIVGAAPVGSQQVEALERRLVNLYWLNCDLPGGNRVVDTGCVDDIPKDENGANLKSAREVLPLHVAEAIERVMGFTIDWSREKELALICSILTLEDVVGGSLINTFDKIFEIAEAFEKSYPWGSTWEEMDYETTLIEFAKGYLKEHQFNG